MASSPYCWPHLTPIQKQGPISVATEFMKGSMKKEGPDWDFEEWENLW